MRALYRVRFASLFSRARGVPEEKPITVDRPNRIYVLTRVRDEVRRSLRNARRDTRARVQIEHVFYQATTTKEDNDGARTRASRRANEARCL